MQIDLTLESTVRIAQRRAARRTPWLPLLSELMELAGGKAELVRHAERSWASATFCGTRHSVILSFPGADGIATGEAFLGALPEHEFTIAGQLVADAGISEVEHVALPEPRLTVTVDLLLLEDA